MVGLGKLVTSPGDMLTSLRPSPPTHPHPTPFPCGWSADLSVVDVADDAVDLDIGYSGTIDTVFVLRRGNTSSAFEVGGCSACGSATSSFSVIDVTVIDDLYTGTRGLAAMVNQKSPVTRGNVLNLLVCGAADIAEGHTTLFGVDCAINGTDCLVTTAVS